VQQDYGQPRDIETDEQAECEPLDPTVPLCPRHHRVAPSLLVLPTLYIGPTGSDLQ